ncbi:acyl-CoA dehydrogenase family protein [Streptomyces sp. NBC_00882]|uniref:acyl-CoA dehydrogenase family protein n=1 Tax=Streptomyces TaxID=1883 RepID=UPI0038680B52|nr:acyl-CoA dehydrogenase family protein [Streptomyces sp. NBC_00882]WSZ62737.1 acyl-CoA dehydrogenase family protein [Streptomyces canus]
MSVLDILSADERLVVRTVRKFVDRDVRPVVRELEHSDTYPEQLIETMKELGIYGLAIPEEYGGNPVSTPCFVLVTEELALNAVRIHGGYGYSTEFDVERYFRDAPLMIVGEGTNEIQRNVIAAQLVARGGLDG